LKKKFEIKSDKDIVRTLAKLVKDQTLDDDSKNKKSIELFDLESRNHCNE